MSSRDYSFPLFVIMLCSISSCMDQCTMKNDLREIKAVIKPTDGAPSNPPKVRTQTLTESKMTTPDQTRSKAIEVMADAIHDASMEDDWISPKIAAAVALTALEAEGMVVVPGWQPIESAPKDGTHILLGSPDNEDDETAEVSTLGWWQDAEDDGPDYMGADGGFVDHAFSEFYPGRSFGNPAYQRAGTQPTHWQPVPDPPASPYGKAGKEESK